MFCGIHSHACFLYNLRAFGRLKIRITTSMLRRSCAVLRWYKFGIIICVKLPHWTLELNEKHWESAIRCGAFLNDCVFVRRRRSYSVGWKLSWLVFNLAACAICKGNRRNIMGKFSSWPSIIVQTWGVCVSARMKIWRWSDNFIWWHADTCRWTALGCLVHWLHLGSPLHSSLVVLVQDITILRPDRSHTAV